MSLDFAQMRTVGEFLAYGALKTGVIMAMAVPVAAFTNASAGAQQAAWSADVALSDSFRRVAPRPLEPGDVKRYQQAFALSAQGQWRRALSTARRAKNPVLAKVLNWLYFKSAQTKPDFAAIDAFLRGNPDWPQRVTLQKRAEQVMPSAWSPQQVVAWFDSLEPLSGNGRVRHANALLALGQRDKGLFWLRRAWIEDNFPARDRRALYRQHKSNLLPEDHEARLDRLLWQRKYRQARGMLGVVARPSADLARVRMALRVQAGGVDRRLARLPSLLLQHPGLVYERVRWRRRKGKHQGAVELLNIAPKMQGIYAKKWWVERRFQTRRLLREGAPAEAYSLVARHRQTPGSLGYAEAEWLAGWIALRFLDRAAAAYNHFKTLHGKVRFPVSLARAAYWAGRASEAAGGPVLPELWYRQAADYPTTYYGQLASARLHPDRRWRLGAPRPVSQADIVRFAGRELVHAVRYIFEIDQHKLLKPFFLRLNDLVQGPGERRLLALLALRVGRLDLAVRTSKLAAKAGEPKDVSGYPITPLPALAIEPALTYAIIRQESEFRAGAVSRAGALGLMQLMPATAKRTARKLSLPYRQNLLLRPDYNMRLASAHFADLLRKYNNSIALSLAAYNAGDGRANRWIKQFGDPRKPDVDEIDWIELIPFNETRNYVQRVLENFHVYRQRLNDAELDLQAGLQNRLPPF